MATPFTITALPLSSNADDTTTVIPYKEERTYHCVKLDNSGISASDKVTGDYKQVMKVSQSSISFSDAFNVFIGRLSLTDFIIHVLRDQLQVKAIITNILTAFLSKWIQFNDDGTITINGATIMNNGVKVNGTAGFNNEVIFGDHAHFQGKADFTSDVNTSGMATFSGKVDFGNDVNFDDDVSIQKDIEVIGKAILKDNVNIVGDLLAKGAIRVRGGVIETDNEEDVELPHPETPRPDKT